MRSPLLDAPWTQKGGTPKAPESGQLCCTYSAWTISGAVQWVRPALLDCAAIRDWVTLHVFSASVLHAVVHHE
jgi:hypothetical protein